MSPALLPLAFAEATQTAPAWMQFVPILLIFGVFYFLLIAPMRKRQKALEAMIAELKKGDRVITSGGLHGEVAGVQDGVVILKLADNLKVRVSKSAISGLQGQQEPGARK